MALSKSSVRRLIVAVTAAKEGNEIASAINGGQNLSAQSGATLVSNIVATSVSPTTNFAALAVGDIIVHIPAAAGNSNFFACAVAGTLPAAAVIGDLYQVSRAFVAPAASKEKL